MLAAMVPKKQLHNKSRFLLYRSFPNAHRTGEKVEMKRKKNKKNKNKKPPHPFCQRALFVFILSPGDLCLF